MPKAEAVEVVLEDEAVLGSPAPLVDSVIIEEAVEDLVLIPLDSDGWNGHLTKLKLAYPLIRDNRIVKAGDSVIFQSSFSDGRWRGPEAEHVHDLVIRGVVDGNGAVQRKQRQAIVDGERGVLPDPSDPDFKPVPGIHERSSAEVEATLGRMLAGGPTAMIAREKAELADAVKELQTTMATFAQSMTDALKLIAANAVGPPKED